MRWLSLEHFSESKLKPKAHMTTPRKLVIYKLRKLERARRFQERRADLLGKPNLQQMLRMGDRFETIEYMRMRMHAATLVQSGLIHF